MPLMNGWERGRPASGSANPPEQIGRERSGLLIVSRNNGDTKTSTGETTNTEGGIACFPSDCSIGFWRHPECQSMNPTARSFVTDIRKGEKAGNLIASTDETMAMQDTGGIAMNALVLA